MLCTLRSTKREIHPREEVVVLLSNSRSSVINLQLMKGQRTELCVLVSPSCGETFGTWNSEHIPHILSFEKPPHTICFVVLQIALLWLWSA